MPGLVEMENGVANGTRTDHDRDVKPNGSPDPTVNIVDAPDDAPPKAPLNGVKGDAPACTRMNDLPDEIFHITEGYIPLGLLLSRLTQSTHNAWQEKVVELSRMAIPASASNGNANYSDHPDDISTENLRKKALILDFSQETHAKFVKALVIADWSQKSEKVSKLIDLKAHIDRTRLCYDTALDGMINIKRDLTYARLPKYDLKTAFQVLSTGSGSWMPDLGFVEPPPLSLEEQERWVGELNVLLSIRLNLDEYDNLPPQFRNYTVASGRVTFAVAGEFEVDLTVADEDPEKQFWFLDFRFAFGPGTQSVSDDLRNGLEATVNATLLEKGLRGCYQLLHEFVLTHKINELRRQATELNAGMWSGSLKVEPLQRALAVQYWAARSPKGSAVPKQWVLIAVNSGRRNGRLDPDDSSRLCLKWYRDGKEATGAEIPFDQKNLSMEAILTSVVGMHVFHLLFSIFHRLAATPRFRNREASLSLTPPDAKPEAMALSMALGSAGSISLGIEPVTGTFAVRPQTRAFVQEEKRIDASADPVVEAVAALETARWKYMVEELTRRTGSSGWNQVKNPLSNEPIKKLLKAKLPFLSLFFQRSGWCPDWYLMVTMSQAGDGWWLLLVDPKQTTHPIRCHANLPLNCGRADVNDLFWNRLTLFVTGVLAQVVAQSEMTGRGIRHGLRPVVTTTLPNQVQVQTLITRLSNFLPSIAARSSIDIDAFLEPQRNRIAAAAPTYEGSDTSRTMTEAGGTTADVNALKARKVGRADGRGGSTAHRSSLRPWAHDVVEIMFKGVEFRQEFVIIDPPAPPARGAGAGAPPPRGSGLLSFVSDAVVRVLQPGAFRVLKGGPLGHNVYYDAKRGEFRIRMCHELGTSVLDTLASRIRAIDRLVSFVDASNNVSDDVRCVSAKLGRVEFSYPGWAPPGADPAASAAPRWPVVLDLAGDEIGVALARGNPHGPVHDKLVQLVNSNEGFAGLMMYLPPSLELFSSLEIIRSRWAARANQKVLIEIKSLDHIFIHYDVTDLDAKNWTVALALTSRFNDGAPWWYLTRFTHPGVVLADDRFAAALRNLWSASHSAYKGLVHGAAAPVQKGSMEMMLAVDDTITALVTGQSVPSSAAPAPPAAATAPMPAVPAQAHAHALTMMAGRIGPGPGPNGASSLTARGPRPGGGGGGAPVAQMGGS